MQPTILTMMNLNFNHTSIYGSDRRTLLQASACALLIFSVTAFTLIGCQPPTSLSQVKEHGVLEVITRNSPTTYYEDRNGQTGFEYELAKLFAEDLGVKLRVAIENDLSSMLNRLHSKEVHMAAAGLTITPERQLTTMFSTPYFNITQKLVYHVDANRPTTIQDILDKKIMVSADSSHAERLRQIQKDVPELTWQESNNTDVIDLLKKVEIGEIDYTILDSNDFSVNQAIFPLIRAAFNISPPEQLAWAFPLSADNSLHDAANTFFARIEKDGSLDKLKERFYGHTKHLTYVGAQTLFRHAKERLPRYEAMFREAAEVNNIDWRLLASVGYQESLWNPRATSPTGVKGLMMLTRVTAKDLKVSNREAPDQSIEGGGRYLREMLDRLPEDVQEPDRTWLALAAYNVGLGHLEDARKLTEMHDKNPDKWQDVKEFLPLLQEKSYYTLTKHGYARGREPVQYVQNIRRYYEVMIWAFNPDFRGLPLPEEHEDFPEIQSGVPVVL